MMRFFDFCKTIYIFVSKLEPVSFGRHFHGSLFESSHLLNDMPPLFLKFYFFTDASQFIFRIFLFFLSIFISRIIIIICFDFESAQFFYGHTEIKSLWKTFNFFYTDCSAKNAFCIAQQFKSEVWPLLVYSHSSFCLV